MQGILEWGLGLVRAFQTVASPGLTAFMKGISFLGTEWFYIAALPVVYWCVDRRRGLRLSVLFLLSGFANHFLKAAFGQPRPYDLDPSVGLAHETTPGLPSGHAQGSLLFWGGLAPLFRRPLGLALAVFLPLLVGLSRIYLGVHFPTDVLAGWLLGGAFLAVEAFWGEALLARLEAVPPRYVLAGAALVALLMNALTMADTSFSGAFLGAVGGFVLANTKFTFSVEGSLAQKALRCLLGFAVTAGLYLGLKAVFPAEGEAQYALFRFLRYGLITLWVGAGAPWVFLRLRLAEPGTGTGTGTPA